MTNGNDNPNDNQNEQERIQATGDIVYETCLKLAEYNLTNDYKSSFRDQHGA